MLSDREHAKRTGVHHQTVGSVREALESTGEIIQSTQRVSADGRVRPAEQLRSAPENVDTDTGEIEPEPVKPRRRPINDLLREAGAELDRAVERINRLAQDDRYAANTDLINPYIRNAIHQLETITQEN